MLTLRYADAENETKCDHNFFSRYGGRTNTQAALQMLYDNVFRSDRGDRNGVDNIAIVMTDGGSNINRANTVRRAQDAKNRGTTVRWRVQTSHMTRVGL